MRRCHRWFALSLAVALLQPAGAARVRVKADRVNLRAAAQETAEVVGQVSTGDELDALSDLSDAWVQVVPPSSVDLWVFAELVHDGAVIVSKAQVRSGAGLSFKVVGSLRRGTRVVERGRLGDWVKIAPPEGTSLWVSREFLEPVGGVAATPAPAPVPVPVPPPTEVPSPATPEPQPPAPSVAPVAPDTPPRFPPTDPRYPEVPLPDAPAAAGAVPGAPSATPASASPVEAAATVQVPAAAGADPSVPAVPPSAPSTEPVVVLDPAALPVPAAAPAFAGAPLPDRAATAGWEDPGPGGTVAGAAAAAAAPVTPVPPPRPRVLLPQQPDAGKVVGPAGIPKDRLSPHATQGKPGRYEGQLSRAGALFYTPSDHRLMVINRAGKAVTVCYVLGNETQLNGMSGARLAIEGPVYWFKSTQYPTILAERIQRLP